LSEPEDELTRTRRLLVEQLEETVDRELFSFLSKILGDADLVMLHALGIDGHAKIMDILIDRCRQMKETP
jgi:hypothetical protein